MVVEILQFALMLHSKTLPFCSFLYLYFSSVVCSSCCTDKIFNKVIGLDS